MSLGQCTSVRRGLEKGERHWVDVRPLRKSGGKTYEGVARGSWAKGKPAKSLETRFAQGGRGLTAAKV